MWITTLMVFLMTPAPAPQGDVPDYFVKFIQERTLFASDESVRLTIRLGNQTQGTLRSRKFPDILAGLKVVKGDKTLEMSDRFSSKGFYKNLRNLDYGAHRDFRFNLNRYFPGMAEGGIYRVYYNDQHYDLESKPIRIASVPLPDIDKPYLVRTSLGDFTIELDSEQAPNHSRNFALLTAMGFYQDMLFHRVIPRFVIQTGDPLGTGEGGSGYPLMLEKSPFLKNTPYAVGMARNPDDLHSATSQFYICLDRIEELDEGYTIFGKVVDGSDVIDSLGSVPTNGPNGTPPNKPLSEVKLISISVVD